MAACVKLMLLTRCFEKQLPKWQISLKENRLLLQRAGAPLRRCYVSGGFEQGREPKAVVAGGPGMNLDYWQFGDLCRESQQIWHEWKRKRWEINVPRSVPGDADPPPAVVSLRCFVSIALSIICSLGVKLQIPGKSDSFKTNWTTRVIIRPSYFAICACWKSAC